MTFADSFAFPNSTAITFSPVNANFAGILTKLYVTPTTTGGELYVGLTALSISTTYVGSYQVSGW